MGPHPASQHCYCHLNYTSMLGHYTYSSLFNPVLKNTNWWRGLYVRVKNVPGFSYLFVVEFNFLSLGNVKLPKLGLQVRVCLQLDQGLRDRSLEHIGLSGASLDDLRTHLQRRSTNIYTQHIASRLENLDRLIPKQIQVFTENHYNALRLTRIRSGSTAKRRISTFTSLQNTKTTLNTGGEDLSSHFI